MWKITPIRNSNGIIFDRFDAILAIAKSMKGCHTFYLSKEDNCIYGCNEEYYCIHVIDIDPNIIHIPISLVFKILCINADIVQVYKSFVLYPEAPWIMLPTATIDRHVEFFNPIYKDENQGWILQHKEPIDYINLTGIDTKQGIMGIEVNNIIDMVNRKKAIEPYLGEYQFFGNKEKDPLIQEVFANKASEGCKYMRLTNIAGKNYGFMLFKNLFNMNKADNLTIIIRDRLDNPTLYEATFVTTKKKSPIPDILPQYIERTYTMFMNI